MSTVLDRKFVGVDTEEIPFHCTTCGNENPYVFGKIDGEDCLECVESDDFTNSLI